MNWYVYILRCADGSFYTGVTNDPAARLDAHRKGKGAKYTRGRGPLEMVHLEEWETKILACQREFEIKSWNREQKLAILA